MQITTTFNNKPRQITCVDAGECYSAYFETPSNEIGWGATPSEAVIDLLINHGDWEHICWTEQTEHEWEYAF